MLQIKDLYNKTFVFMGFSCFTLFDLSRPSHNTTSQKYWGDQCMGRPPLTSNFGGTVPPVPLGLRLCLLSSSTSSSSPPPPSILLLCFHSQCLCFYPHY